MAILKYICLFMGLFFVSSCKKNTSWDTALNGKWEEVLSNNVKALPSNCFIQFNENEMLVCDQSLTASLNDHSHLHAQKGQIWISYRLSFRKHEEYRYDYSFEGDYLWLTEETTPQYTGKQSITVSKKYRKLP